MYSAMKEITSKDFETEVLKCELPVFSCFTTEWCRSCYPTCLLADELAEKYAGRAKFVRLDIDKSPEVAASYRIVVLPTIIVFHDSQPVKKLVGFQDRKSLKRLLDSVTAGLKKPRTGGLSQTGRETMNMNWRKYGDRNYG
jgi:thioredoxin 1